ncbi:MAG: hypothetical protein AAFO73_06210 [Pseudomonadota bacterium]
MSIAKSKTFKTTVAAVLASAVLATSFATSAHAGKKDRLFWGGVAAGVIGTAIIANERRKARERRRAHRYHYSYSDCYIKRRKVWSDYHGRRVWRKVEVCY